MTDEGKRAEGEISEEMKRLGKQLHTTAKAAWESEERREIQAEVISGLNALASEIEKTLKEFRAGPEGQALKAKTRELKEKAQSEELSKDVRSALLEVFRQINTELENLQKSLTKEEKE